MWDHETDGRFADFILLGEERRRMAIGTLNTLRAGATLWTRSSSRTLNFASSFVHRRDKRNISIKSSSFDPPDVGRLAETARISLTPQEVIKIQFSFNFSRSNFYLFPFYV